MAMTLPKIKTYARYSNGNYGAHALVVEVGGVTLWFSYDTLVAFQVNGVRRVSENAWGPTTGKHLKWIDGGDKGARLPREQFEREWAEAATAQGVE